MSVVKQILRLSLFAGLLAAPWFSQAAPSSKPNIIFLLTDDMGYGDIACYGGKFVPTPQIDQLAAEGTKFTQFYADAPLCSPSRAAFTTGMFPARWHFTTYLQTRAGNRKCEQADFLDPKAPSIARTLKEAGYVTAHFGKWHMGGGRDVTNAPPLQRIRLRRTRRHLRKPRAGPDHYGDELDLVQIRQGQALGPERVFC